MSDRPAVLAHSPSWAGGNPPPPGACATGLAVHDLRGKDSCGRSPTPERIEREQLLWPLETRLYRVAVAAILAVALGVLTAMEGWRWSL